MALLALALKDRPVTDAGVWLDKAPMPGTVVAAPLTLAGETQAPEGVLSIDLYEGTTKVATYAPPLPVGTIRFSFTWRPSATPGTYDLHVVSTTLLRDLRADVHGLVVVAPVARPVATRSAPAQPPAPVATPRARPLPLVARPVLDDSGRAFGTAAPTLPYAPVTVTSPAPVTRAALVPEPENDRSGWVSFAAGLLLLVVCSHLHRSLRPPPRGTT